MLGRLATRLYGIGRRTYANTMKVLVAHKLLGQDAPKPPKAKKAKVPKAARPKGRRVTNAVPKARHNQTVPARPTVAQRTKFKQASNRRV
jgi:hypothetical protein